MSILAVAAAVALSLQPEVGVNHMSAAPDDFWYEQGLPHKTAFDTLAFGVSVRADMGHVQLSLGWRNLGNQHQTAQIIADSTYFDCRDNHKPYPAATQLWTMTGSEQQTFVEVGYAFNLPHNWRVVPSVGYASTRIQSHVDFYDMPDMAPVHTGWEAKCVAPTQHLGKAFYGLAAQHGAWGVGAEFLDTGPDRSANNCDSPIQGSSSIYLRITYAFKVY